MVQVTVCPDAEAEPSIVAEERNTSPVGSTSVTTTAPLGDGPEFEATSVKVTSPCDAGVAEDADFVSVITAKRAGTEKEEPGEVMGVEDPGRSPEAVAASLTEPLSRSARVTV
jgi:hypothetical protein